MLLKTGARRMRAAALVSVAPAAFDIDAVAPANRRRR
jgi:hypothetical protein